MVNKDHAFLFVARSNFKGPKSETSGGVYCQNVWVVKSPIWVLRFLGVKCFPSPRSVIFKSPDAISFAIDVLVVGLLSDKDENVVEIKQVESQQKITLLTTFKLGK